MVVRRQESWPEFDGARRKRRRCGHDHDRRGRAGRRLDWRLASAFALCRSGGAKPSAPDGADSGSFVPEPLPGVVDHHEVVRHEHAERMSTGFSPISVSSSRPLVDRLDVAPCGLRNSQLSAASVAVWPWLPGRRPARRRSFAFCQGELNGRQEHETVDDHSWPPSPVVHELLDRVVPGDDAGARRCLEQRLPRSRCRACRGGGCARLGGTWQTTASRTPIAATSRVNRPIRRIGASSAWRRVTA